uniref:Uncharacterized protein n=1 Tax=Caenorhabditis tropicalis TaxID=1561998 RepID=A0A1I7TCX9_9PELO
MVVSLTSPPTLKGFRSEEMRHSRKIHSPLFKDGLHVRGGSEGSRCQFSMQPANHTASRAPSVYDNEY